MSQELIGIPEVEVRPEELVLPKARDFVRYLLSAGPDVFARLHRTGRTPQSDGEIVTF